MIKIKGGASHSLAAAKKSRDKAKSKIKTHSAKSAQT